MININNLIEIIYSEKDIARSIAIFFSGIAGLIIYLTKNDMGIAIFLSIITFPIINLLFSKIIQKYNDKKSEEYAFKTLDDLSDKELQVLKIFVSIGTTVIHSNEIAERIQNSNATYSILDSLQNRKIIYYEMNQFFIELNIFTLLKKRYGNIEEKYEENHCDFEIPF